MSLLQWQLGHLNISFEKEVPVPSYISFEQVQPHLQPFYAEEESDEEFFLQGGANPNYENMYNRYRVVASAEITERADLNGREIDFNIQPNRPGKYGM